MAALLDTHCHLDLDVFETDRNEVIERARLAEVEQMIVIGFNPARWETGANLCRRHAGIHLAVGLHPTEAETYDDTLEMRLRSAAISERAVAIGETGIDYHWQPGTAKVQKEAFARQIMLAKDLDLPFVVHQREAERDTLDVLRSVSPPHRGVMHCFTGDREFLRDCLDLGLHIGIGGAVTFRKLKALHCAAQSAPLDRIILETDAPFMTPSPHRGQRNEPSYLRFVADRLGEIRGVAAADIASATTFNARELFRLPALAGSFDESARGENKVLVVLASHNRGKVKELTELLPEWIEVRAADDFGVVLPEETGDTFYENALLKARAVARSLNVIAIADDSGLEVDELGGEPGVRSARFAGESASDAENNALLLKRLEGVESTRRTARFRSVVAVVAPDGTEFHDAGTVEGEILIMPRGTGGFGYDPLFRPRGIEHTFAELPLDEKNKISHRGAAFRKVAARLIPFVQAYQTIGKAGVDDPGLTSG